MKTKAGGAVPDTDYKFTIVAVPDQGGQPFVQDPITIITQPV